MNRILPPQLAVALLVVFVPLGLIVPLVGPWPLWGRLLGVPIFVLGAGLALAASRRFERVGTNIKTFDDPDVLVTTGAFAWSRNPMYLGLLVALCGVAVLVGGVTVWLAPIGFFAASAYWYIPFEERRMAATFGSAYAEYRQQVRRWFTIARRPSTSPRPTPTAEGTSR